MYNRDKKRARGNLSCLLCYPQVADEYVVVIKPRPVKVGNRPEDKTEVTYS